MALKGIILQWWRRLGEQRLKVTNELKILNLGINEIQIMKVVLLKNYVKYL